MGKTKIFTNFQNITDIFWNFILSLTFFGIYGETILLITQSIKTKPLPNWANVRIKRSRSHHIPHSHIIFYAIGRHPQTGD